MLVYGSHPTHNCSSSSISIISMRVIIVIFGLFIVNPKLLALSQRSPSTSPCCSERIHFTSPQVALTFREKKSRGIDRHPVKQESSEHDSNFVLREAGLASVTYLPPQYGSSPLLSDTLNSWYANVTADELKDLYRVYFADFVLFDYDIEMVMKEKHHNS